MNELTDEQQKDSAERVQKFIEGYQKLVEETSVDFGQMPQYVPIGKGMFATVLFNQPQDKKYLDIPSDLSQLV